MSWGYMGIVYDMVFSCIFYTYRSMNKSYILFLTYPQMELDKQVKLQKNFTAIEMEESWECSYCNRHQPYEQMAMKEIKWKDIICPDCYFEL